MQIWSLDTMGTTDSKVMVSTTTGQKANATEGTYAKTESLPRKRDQGCQVQDFNYTGGACTAVGRCTKEELMAELASIRSHDEKGEVSSEFSRPSILVSYKPFDEVNVKSSAEKKKRFSLTGLGTRHELMQQKEVGPDEQRPVSGPSGSKQQMVEYASTTNRNQTIPSARIQLVQAKTTNKSSTPSDAKQQTAINIESHTNTNDSTSQNKTDEKIAQRKSLVGFLKKEVERKAHDTKTQDAVKNQDNKPTSDGDETVAVGFSAIIQSLANVPQHSANVESHESTSNQIQNKEGIRKPAGLSLTKLDINEDREDDKGKKEAQNPSTKEVSTKATQESNTNETQNALKKEGFGRLFNRTGQSTSSTRHPMNRSSTVAYTLTTTENTTDANLTAQDSTRKESSTKTVEYSLSTTENSANETPKRKLFKRAKTINEPETTSKNEGPTKAPGVSGDQHQTVESHTATTVESHTTTTTVAGQDEGAQNPSKKEAPTKEPESTSKKGGRPKLFSRIGQSYNVSPASGVSRDQNQTVESHTITSNKATVAGHTEESVTTSKKEGRTKLFGRIGQSYNVTPARRASGNQQQTVESHATTSTVESNANKTTIAGHTEGSEVTSRKEGRSKLFGRIGQSYNVSAASGVSGAQHQTVESHTSTTVESRTSTVTVEGHTNGAQNVSKKEASTTVTQHASRSEGFGKLFGRTGQSTNTTTAMGGGTTTTTTVGTHVSTSPKPDQPTSSSGLVSYSASTDSQRSRDKAGLAKFFQARVNAKESEKPFGESFPLQQRSSIPTPLL
ncbi:hypothetical protein TSMEX_011852 [Taenia solium]|eukprot:TsM_000518500 transcript=TsM_000518500 gene=TsM_000518500